MFKIRFKGAEMNISKASGEWVLSLAPTPEFLESCRRFVNERKDIVYIAELKEYRKARSLDANGYMWALIDQISATVGLPPDEVYHKALHRAGTLFQDADGNAYTFKVRGDKVGEMKGRIYSHSRYVESVFEGEDVYHVFALIKGSSEYNTKEMSRLVDEVVFMAQELGIETATPNEIALMKERYKGHE